MFWADELLKNQKGKQVVNDSFTPSGMVHMGSLKGPVIHDVLQKALKEKGEQVEFRYGFDDFDPIDGLAPDLYLSHKQYLGVPLFLSPSPEGKGQGSFADYYIVRMKGLLFSLGIHPNYYRTSQLYKEGIFNKAIQIVLDDAQGVRDVYGAIYKKTIPSDWYPFQVICPKCGKLGTTKITRWDGKEVSFVCKKDLVKWAQGCETTGKISPFDGNGKMSWKVEWAAKWFTFGVTIEGAGKDHASAGGSYDIAMKLCSDVFNTSQPLKLGYEFFLSGGKKMSSSKGLGLTGEKLLEALGPQRARFIMIKSPPNQAIEFTPKDTLVIPKLFDDYQSFAESKDDDHRRVFQFSQVDIKEKVPNVRFQTLAQWVQMPNMEDTIKKENLEEWAKYARIWVKKYAPESEKFIVQKTFPGAAKNLSEKQKEFLKRVSDELEKKWGAEEFQTELYEWAKETGVSSKEAFAAIYLSLIGKDHGPKAGWLILSLDKEFVMKRFEEVSLRAQRSNPNEIATSSSFGRTPRNDKGISEIFSIDQKVKEKFPSISVGVAIVKNVRIEKSNTDLEKEKETLLKSLESLTTEQLGQYPEVISYRKLYKEMKVDWHSKRPSPEALLRRIALKKSLYTVNTCVDADNLVVVKHRVSVGAFDLDKLSMRSVLRFPKPGEKILLLGDTEETLYKETELGYFDKNGGYNIDFNYRDAKRTAVQTTTKNLYINVDGIYDITPDKVEQVLKDACDTVIKYCGGKLELFGIETASS